VQFKSLLRFNIFYITLVENSQMQKTNFCDFLQPQPSSK
jgi:hypothetical protein